MKIKLNNIKQHKQREFNFPDSGLVRIAGSSGAGKTSIFEAIEEALFASGGPSLTTHGCKTRSVELYMGDLSLIRTRGSHTLTVNGAKDDAAQAIIHDALKATHDEFKIAAYVRQDGDASLLSQAPTQMMATIMSLAGIDEEYTDNLKKKISKKISELEKFIEYKGGQLPATQKVIDTFQGLLTTRSHMSLMPVNEYHLPIMEKEIADMRRRMGEVHDRIKGIATSKDGDTESGLIRQIKELQNNCSDIERQKNALIVRGKALKSVLDDHWLNDPLDPANEECVELVNELLKYQGGKDAVAIDLQIRSEELTIMAKVPKLEAQYKALELEIKRLKQVLLDAPQKCPDCAVPLRVSANSIITHADHFDSAVIEKQIKECQDKKSEINMSLAQVPIEKNKLDQTRWRPLRELSMQYGNVITKIERILGQLRADLTSLSVQHTQILNKINDLQIRATIARTNDRALAAIRAGEVEIADLMTQIDQKTADKNNLISQIEVNNWSTKVSEALKEMDQIKKDVGELSKKITDLKKLREIIQLSITAAIEDKIEEINAAAAVYLDQFFDENTQITILPFKTNKAGDEKPKLEISVYHRGQKFNSIKELSGGERSRAVLAYQLGLSDLHDMPILMIDEGFTGLEPERRLSTMEVLKEVAERKLVLVIEHGAPEHLFDEIVNV